MARPLVILYPCPHPNCHYFSSTRSTTVTHYSTTHAASAAPVIALFGRQGITLLLRPQSLTLTPAGRAATHLVCFPCAVIFDTPDAAELHIHRTPAHAAAAEEVLAEYGPPGLHRLFVEMSTAAAAVSPNPLPQLVNNQHNFVVSNNREQAPAAAPEGVGSVIPVRILHDRLRGASVKVPRATTWCAFVAQLDAASGGALDWPRLVRAKGGIQMGYRSVKMDGGRASWSVSGERGWRRLMGDVCEGARIEGTV